mgnify:CR=1 FL=1
MTQPAILRYKFYQCQGLEDTMFYVVDVLDNGLKVKWFNKKHGSWLGDDYLKFRGWESTLFEINL